MKQNSSNTDPGVKEAIRRRNEFQLSESAAYYFNAIDRIAAVDYVPSDKDILRCRVKAPGVAELSLQVCLHLKPSTLFARNYFAACGLLL